jgi:hypothetical protein
MDKPKLGKKPFETPTLTEYGTLDELTLHHKPPTPSWLWR